MITIAIPVYGAKAIAWLPMEGLCRQENAPPFEVIIYEDDHSASRCGQAYFEAYADRLADVGCVGLTYISNPFWVPLPQKWAHMAKLGNGEIFCMQAADDLPPSNRLQIAKELYSKGFDWSQQRKGYFFNVFKKQVMELDVNTYPRWQTGLNMNIAAHLVKNLPQAWDRMGIDRWMITNAKPSNVHWIEGEVLGGVQTDGYNSISKGRRRVYMKPEPPFTTTARILEEIVPLDIAQRLRSIK